MNINPLLKQYIQSSIYPRYADNDEAHGLEHILQVTENALHIASSLDCDIDMVYCIASYHDIGIPRGRETHHLTSAAIMMEDGRLKEFFSDEQRLIIKEAIEDHRASSNHLPRSLYGKIIADADRDLDPDRVLLRCMQYAKARHASASEDELISICLNHLKEKYGYGGYLRQLYGSHEGVR